MVVKRIISTLNTCKEIFNKALLSGFSPQRLAKSFCIGLYIAFSPFPGMHTIMMLISKYFFKLHFPTLFFATSLNNPWTMIPFFSCDYAFGYWFIHSLIGWKPEWHFSLASIFGSGSICLWSFLIGGNVLGILAALFGYPIMLNIFKQLVRLSNQTSSNLNKSEQQT